MDLPEPAGEPAYLQTGAKRCFYMMAACAAAAHGLVSLEAFWSAAKSALVLAGIVVAFFILAYLLISSEKAFPFMKLTRSGFEVGFTPFKKAENDDEEAGGR